MDIIDKYHNYLLEKGYSRSALESYEISLRSFLDFLNQETSNIEDITEETLERYKHYIKQELSPQTVNTRLAATKNFIAFLNNYKGYNIEYQNIKAVKIKKKKTTKRIGNIDRLINYIKKTASGVKTKKRDELIFKMLYFTGARTKDIVHIKKQDIGNGVATIGQKQILLSSTLLEEINNYTFLINAEKDDYIFCNFSLAFKHKQKTPLTEKSIEELFNKYKVAINKDLTIRDLRNSFVLDIEKDLPDIHTPRLWQEYKINSHYLSYINDHNTL